eukprot:tig00000663_g2963.t1
MEPREPAPDVLDADDGGEAVEEPGEDEDDACGFKSFVEESAQLLQLVGELPTSREESTAEKICAILDKYQEQPQLLDPHLETILAGTMARVKRRDVPADVLPRLFRVVYHITKVRGYKTCVRFFPHEVADLERTVLELEGRSAGAHGEWEARYVLLLWLSILVIIPFDLASVDSSLGGGEAGGAGAGAGRILTRPDVQKERLEAFFEWARGVLAGAAEPGASPFVAAGVLSTLAGVFKAGHRRDLAPLAPALLGPVLAAGGAGGGAAGGILQRKLAAKVAQRLALAHLPPRLAPWRYQRVAEWRGIGGGGGGGPVGGGGGGRGREEEEWEVAGEVEEVLGILLDALRDRDTVVRWSAAKGVGRVAARLPPALADDVVRSVLDLLAPAEGEGAWHGGCLALGELARRGALLPGRLAEALPRLLRALEYDELRGAHSVGAHVRDAACYVCWAFARAYEPALMHEHLRALAAALLACAVFDREVNCRRAAAAAFQENVGRQGAFPHGIEIVTAADYYSVGPRPSAFTLVAPAIARFEEYRGPLAEHLVRRKVPHWDPAVRDLAARALGRIAPLDPALFAAHVLPNLVPRCVSAELSERHGAALAVAEVVLALCAGAAGPEALPEALRGEVPEIVARVEAARLYRGRGGEIMRAAVCRLVECVALAGLPLHEKARAQMLATIDECARHPNVRIATRAVAACRAFSARYLAPAPDAAVPEKVLQRTTDRFLEVVERDENAAARRGIALALGPSRGPSSAVHALVAAGAAGAALLGALGDYSVDSRGDVGSWVREAAMAGLERLLLLLAAPASRLGPPPPGLVQDAFGALLKQLAEKIDRVRRVAGEVLHRLLHAREPAVPGVPHRAELEEIFPAEECGPGAGMNWAAPGATFPRVVRALALPAYASPVLSGLVVSVGGLTESLVRHSWAALAAHAAAAAARSPDGPAVRPPRRGAGHGGAGVRRGGAGQGAAGRLAGSLVEVLERHAGTSASSSPPSRPRPRHPPRAPSSSRPSAPQTLDLLLTGHHLDALPAAGAAGVAERVRREVAASKEIVKCMAAAPVLAGLLRFEEPARGAALAGLLGLLRGRFPKARRLAAAELVARFEAPTAPPRPPPASASDKPLAETRGAADELYAMLGVERPKAAPKADAAPARPAAPKDESYTDLVKEMGY